MNEVDRFSETKDDAIMVDQKNDNIVTASSKINEQQKLTDEQEQEQMDKILEGSEITDSRMLGKYTDPTQNFVTDAFCAQMLTGDMDPNRGRQVIEDLRKALERKRARELAEARGTKGGAKGKRKLQFVGQLINILEEMFKELNMLAIVPTTTLRKACKELLQNKGFERYNTVFATSKCPENQVEIFRKNDFLPFGGPKGYKMGGLGGLPSCGEMGMFMLSTLVPEDDGRIFIEYGSIFGIDEYGKPGKSARKDERSALLDVVKLPTFPDIALRRLEKEIIAKRQQNSISTEAQRRIIQAKQNKQVENSKRGDGSNDDDNNNNNNLNGSGKAQAEGNNDGEDEEGDIDEMNDDKLEPDEFDEELNHLKESLASHLRNVRRSTQSVKRVAYGLYDEIRSEISSLVKYIFDSKREEAQEYLNENEHRFERQYKNELALSMTREGRRELESRGRLHLYSRDSKDRREKDTLENRNRHRLNDLYLDFVIPVASLGCVHIETPPLFPNFVIVQHFEILMNDGDRLDLTQKLFRKIREVRAKEEDASSSEEDENEDGEGDDGDGGDDDYD